MQLVFVIIGASMGALGLMILFVGCLATGATRHKVYRTWGGRVGGRVSCAVVSTYVFTHSVDDNDTNTVVFITFILYLCLQFMGITYVLQVAWLLMLCFLVVVTIVFTTFWGLCSSHRVAVEHRCINFDQFGRAF